jgi:hypothetical protein
MSYLKNREIVCSIITRDIKEFGYCRPGHLEDFEGSVYPGVPGVSDADEIIEDPEFLKEWKVVSVPGGQVILPV